MGADTDEFTERDRAWWTSRGRDDARNDRRVLMYPARGGGVVSRGGDMPDDWSEAYALAAARAYYTAYCEALA